MDHAHKQRLVGGIVLLSLALILIPTILDFSQDELEPVQREVMPDAPDAMKMEVLPLEIWSERIDPEVDSQSRIVETPSVETPIVVKESLEKESPEAAAPAVVVKAEKKKESKPVVTKVEPKPAAKAVVTTAASAWVVQVASFADEPKAFKLRDSLRKAGIACFIERGRGDAGPIYRVKAGPVIRKSEADQLKKQVDKQTKLEGLVMRHR